MSCTWSLFTPTAAWSWCSGGIAAVVAKTSIEADGDRSIIATGTTPMMANAEIIRLFIRVYDVRSWFVSPIPGRFSRYGRRPSNSCARFRKCHRHWFLQETVESDGSPGGNNAADKASGDEFAHCISPVCSNSSIVPANSKPRERILHFRYP